MNKTDTREKQTKLFRQARFRLEQLLAKMHDLDYDFSADIHETQKYIDEARDLDEKFFSQTKLKVFSKSFDAEIIFSDLIDFGAAYNSNDKTIVLPDNQNILMRYDVRELEEYPHETRIVITNGRLASVQK